MGESPSPLNVAVVGAGHLGQHHARLYADLPGCRLIAVVDTDLDRAKDVASRYGGEALDDARRLEGRVDAVSVAVPTESHRDVALPLLEQGVAVLVEKPMAASLEEADELLSVSRRTGALLGVGHTERFNPAVEALSRRASDPRFIEAH